VLSVTTARTAGERVAAVTTTAKLHGVRMQSLK